MRSKNNNLSKETATYQKYALPVVVCISFILIYILNSIYPIYNDDWGYRLTHYGKKVDNLGDIFDTQYDHYLNWGGRIVVHTIAQLLLWCGKAWANLFNSLAFIGLLLSIYFIANKNKRNNARLFVLIGISIWFLQANFAQTILWITGSANYLWGCLITLLFLYPYCSYYIDSNSKDNKLKNGLFCLAGIVAGWTNENLSLAVVFFIVILLAVSKHEKKRIPPWTVWGLIGTVIGCIILIVAPGNYVRLDSLMENNPIDNKWFFYLQRLVAIIRGFARYGLLPSIIYLITTLFFFKNKKHKPFSPFFKLSLLFYCSSIFAIVVMVASPSFPPRAWFGIISYMIVGIAILYANIDFDSVYLKKLEFAGYSLGIALFTITYIIGFSELKKINEIFVEREIEIASQKKLGTENIVLKGKFECKKGLLYIIPKMEDFPSDSTDWRYDLYKQYYNVKSIKIIDE